jgi:hypothetical protein
VEPYDNDKTGRLGATSAALGCAGQLLIDMRGAEFDYGGCAVQSIDMALPFA